MYTITVQTTFKALHQLPLPDGTREPLHEHDWVVRTAVSTDGLDKMGLAIDFNKLKSILDSILAPLNGRKLEEAAAFANTPASAELVAKYIYEQVKPWLATGKKLEYVEVMEAQDCWAKYSCPR